MPAEPVSMPVERRDQVPSESARIVKPYQPWWYATALKKSSREEFAGTWRSAGRLADHRAGRREAGGGPVHGPREEFGELRYGRDQPPARTSILPTFSPRSMPRKASTVCSNPCTTVVSVPIRPLRR